jgi:ATP-dependent exoDNAse (exonuclease V) beta subunit
MLNIKIISAGAGSGKTFRLTQEMVTLLKGEVRASGIIATTFTQKAAAELQERVRVKLLQEGLYQQAEDLSNALIGTVHSLGVKLLQRFAYEAGVSPAVSIIAEEDQLLLFNQSLAAVLSEERVETMTRLSERLGLATNEYFDWRKEVMGLTEVARANAFGPEVLDRSRQRSFALFQEFLGAGTNNAQHLPAELGSLLSSTIEVLETNADETKITKTDAVKDLKNLERELALRGELNWRDWAKLGKIKVGAKSKDDITALQELANRHETLPQFQRDIQAFIDHIFELATAALHEFATYKKQRGLIDYTDMEALILDLLRNEQVREVLTSELDLLLVDEFQDTSPIQLAIFLELSKLTPHSIWVGDPKQSIYGFRGAAPELMQAIIAQTGGVKPEDVQTFSWRSRVDLVEACNAIFTRAFADLPLEQVVLIPKRPELPGTNMGQALNYWFFEPEPDEDGKKVNRTPGRPWLENCIAFRLREWLDQGVWINSRSKEGEYPALPGDVAILCRSNKECAMVAEALNRAGLKVAMSRMGLLNTAEVKLTLACLKYLLNYHDSLSVAEILFLGSGKNIENIIDERLDYLELYEKGEVTNRWGTDDGLIRRLDELRIETVELSSAEILTLLLEELDLRRKIAAWGKTQQRLDNLDVLRALALQYEEACNRLQAAASLGGFLLWLNELEASGKDQQAAGQSPDAVNVLTYHRSKGLEWPIVISHNLDKDIRAELWGLDLMNESDEVDLNNILGNRWLRYWVNPYEKQYHNTPLARRLAESELQLKKKAKAIEEENRLLYVGLTRARDYLILPSTKDGTSWLNRAWQQGKDDLPTLDIDMDESPFEWNGRVIPLAQEKISFPRDFIARDLPNEEIFFQEKRAGRQRQVPLYIDTWRENFTELIARISVGESLSYASPLHPDSLLADMNQVAKAAKAFFLAYRPEQDFAELEKATQAVLQRFNVHEYLEAKHLLPLGKAWHTLLEKQFQQPFYHYKYALRSWQGQRLFEREIDLLLETDQGLVIIQFSSYSGEMGRCRNKAQELAPFLSLAREGVQQVFQEPLVRTYVHFVLFGMLMEVRG